MKLSNKEKLTFAQGANKIAEKVLSKYDLKTVFHHHCGGYIETPDEIDFFMRNTDENLIGLCLDTGHFSFGGGNPIDAIRQYKERIWHVHFKDYNKKIKELGVTNNWDYLQFIENGIFCELNKGNLDFKKISSELIKIKYQGWIVVEQDIIPGMGNPIKYAKKNRKFLYSINL
jgi:inosose dehydratase